MSVNKATFANWFDEFDKLDDCPWPGPRPLLQEDKALLVGRDEDRTRFDLLVRENTLVFLTGVSGVGKSSLVQAGLVPDLEEKNFLVASCRDWGGSSEGGAAHYLGRAVYRGLPEEVRGSFTSGHNVFYELERRYGGQAILIFDQFEELLRHNEDIRDSVIRLIIELHSKFHFRIVLSFRSEYLHELEPIQKSSDLKTYQFASYNLAELHPRFARDIIVSSDPQFGPAPIEQDAAETLSDLWQEALRTRHVGLLHLQAALYQLYFGSTHGNEGRRISLADVHALVPADLPSAEVPQATFDAAIQGAIDTKLRHCVDAARGAGLDRYLVEGTQGLLVRIVPELSSAGYKLVRGTYDLAEAALEEQIDAALRGLDLASDDDEERAREALATMLATLLGDTLRRSASAPSVVSRLHESREALMRHAAESGEPLWFEWSDEQLEPTEWSAGPMMGLSAAAVIIEELRRFAWALTWLRESSLIRLTQQEDNDELLSLIHDGFGPALTQWAEDSEDADEATATMVSLTPPEGKVHAWTSKREIDALRGEVGSEKYFINVNLLGNSIHGGGDDLTTFAHVVFVNCNFRGAVFRKCRFIGVTMVNCRLDGTLFDDCVFVDASPTHHEAIEHRHRNAPVFVVEDAADDAITRLSAEFESYRGETVGASMIVAQPVGQAAVPSIEAPADPAPWRPAQGGLAFYGSRISALTMRGNAFEEGGSVQWYHCTGSGLDIGDIRPAEDRYYFARCSIRHASFSTAAQESVELNVEADECNVAQWWFSVGLEGRAVFRDCDIAQLWVEPSEEQFSVEVQGGAASGLQGAQPTEAVKPLEALRSSTGYPVSAFMDYRR